MIQVQDNAGNIYNLETPNIIIMNINGEEIQIFEPILEDILNQLKTEKRVDVTDKDPLYIAYVEKFIDLGLVSAPTSIVYPFCNQCPLADEEFLIQMCQCFDVKKREYEHSGLIV